MKSLQGFQSAFLAKSAEPFTALDKVDKTLAALVTPDVLGIPINSIVDQNIDNDGAGNIAIMPDMLADSFQIGVTHPAFVRRNPFTPYQLQYSNDGGETWVNFGSGEGGGSGDMLKSDYDPSNHGYVDQAAAIKDGVGTLDADGIRALIPSGAGDMLKSDYDPSNHGYVDQAAAIKDGVGTLDADGIRALIPSIPSGIILTINPINPIPSIEIPLVYGNAALYIRSDNAPADPIIDIANGIALAQYGGTIVHSVSHAKYGASSIYFPNSSYLALNDARVNPSTKDFCLMLWAFLPNGGHQKLIVIDAFQLATQYPSGGAIYCDTGAGDGTGTTDICDSTWHHVAVLRFGGTIKVAVDGIEEISIAVGASFNLDVNGISIGNQIGGGNGIDNGFLDDIYFNVGTSFYDSLPFTPPGYIYFGRGV